MLVENPEQWMKEALRQAKAAEAAGEVPVGAVLVRDNHLIASGFNEVEKHTDATLHAEMIAIRQGSTALGSWRLDGCSLFVTLEPCTMCVGAILLSRVSEIYFGAYDPRQGACGSLFDLSHHGALPHRFTVFPELLAAESESLLKSFFAACRTTGLAKGHAEG